MDGCNSAVILDWLRYTALVLVLVMICILVMILDLVRLVLVELPRGIYQTWRTRIIDFWNI